MNNSISTRLYTLFFGELVGEDKFKNQYYRQKQRIKGLRERRWVIFSQGPEGSAIPPNWQGWLTHTSENPPLDESSEKSEWMIDHRPNPTGTVNAYSPPGSLRNKGDDKAPSVGDYEPWRPE